MNLRRIRIGPAEIYRVALAVAQMDDNVLGGFRLVLLVTTPLGMQPTPDIAMRIRRTLGAKVTPTHVPAAAAAADRCDPQRAARPSRLAVPA